MLPFPHVGVLIYTSLFKKLQVKCKQNSSKRVMADNNMNLTSQPNRNSKINRQVVNKSNYRICNTRKNRKWQLVVLIDIIMIKK